MKLIMTLISPAHIFYFHVSASVSLCVTTHVKLHARRIALCEFHHEPFFICPCAHPRA